MIDAKGLLIRAELNSALHSHEDAEVTARMHAIFGKSYAEIAEANCQEDIADALTPCGCQSVRKRVACI